MGYESIAVEREGNVAIVKLNEPDVLNALSTPMVAELHAALSEILAAMPAASS
ncbi:MAG: hypothetical protein U5O39_14465 [Gammaproteobacteria bacterium]|nr:hypothetical protein [Gammaproteobacteria bacterium]